MRSTTLMKKIGGLDRSGGAKEQRGNYRLPLLAW
jgi:hypothetical protein